MQREIPHVGGVKNQVVAERHGPPQERHLAADGVAPGGELPFLVELAVIRQETLGHDAEHLPPVDDDRAVKELALEAQRRADEEHGGEVRAGFDELGQGVLRRVEQGVLMEQILVGIGGDPQFREERDGSVGFGGAAGEAKDALEVERRVRHPDLRDANRRTDKAVVIDGAKSPVLLHGSRINRPRVLVQPANRRVKV